MTCRTSNKAWSRSLDAGRGQLKCDGTHAETRFLLSGRNIRVHLNRPGGGRQFSRLLAARGVRISGSNAGYTVFRGSVKSTSYPLHSSVSPSLPLPCVSQCAITFQLESACWSLSVVWGYFMSRCATFRELVIIPFIRTLTFGAGIIFF